MSSNKLERWYTVSGMQVVAYQELHMDIKAASPSEARNAYHRAIYKAITGGEGSDSLPDLRLTGTIVVDEPNKAHGIWTGIGWEEVEEFEDPTFVEAHLEEEGD